MELTDTRIAQNQSTFRDANEQIEQAAQRYNVDGRIPFICECAEQTCSAIVYLSLTDYEMVRAGPRQFVVAVGHDRSPGVSSRIVAEHETFTIAEKTGDAGQAAERLDPRSETAR